MSKILLITKNIIKRLFRRKTSLFFVIIIPVSIPVLVIYLLSGGYNAVIPVAVLDNSNTVSSHYVIDSLMKDDSYYIMDDFTEEEINDLIINGDITFAVIIDNDFEDNIINNSDAAVRIVTLNENEATSWVNVSLNYKVKNLVDLASISSYDYTEYVNAIESIDNDGVTFEIEDINTDTSTKELVSQAIGMYLMLLMFSTFTISFLMIEEKELGTFDRINIAPFPKRTYLLGNILSNLIITAIQAILVIGIITLGFKIDLHMNPLLMFLIIMVFGICSITLGVFLTTLAKGSTDSSSLFTFIALPSCMISGCFWSIEYTHKYIQRLAYITPQRWLLDSIKYAQGTGTIFDIVKCLLIVSMYSVIFTLIALYINKNQEETNR